MVSYLYDGVETPFSVEPKNLIQIFNIIKLICLIYLK